MLIYKNKFPAKLNFKNSVLIYDRRFESLSWTKKFSQRYSVKPGEKLKNIDDFPRHIKNLLKLVEGLPKNQICIVALGGGSIGDFAGFAASVLKRGVLLIHVPSTWLAAIDSSHGGKTGLNVAKIKNQVGTFYNSENTYLIKELLQKQTHERLLEAFGEFFKTSLLSHSVWNKVKNLKNVDEKMYWTFLPQLIAVKNNIVKKDPFEKKGHRFILNLGHTMGHVWESQFKLPHGVAVLFGLAFSIEWSFHKGLMSSKSYYDIRLSNLGSYLPDRFDLKKVILRSKKVEKFLFQDKKMSTHKQVHFVFLEKPGHPILQRISLTELKNELARQAR